MDWQTVAALGLVVAAASWTLIRFFRGLKKPGCAGCACRAMDRKS